MHHAIVCQSAGHARLIRQALRISAEEIVCAVESESVDRALRRDGFKVVRGKLSDRAVYRELLPAKLLVVSLRDRRRLRRVLQGIARERGETPVLVFSSTPLAELPFDIGDYGWAHFIDHGDRMRDILSVERRLARAKILVRRLREVLEPLKKVVVMMQDDPDPDGLACALGLRTLLGRNRKTMPMASFGPVSRPENLAMLSVLDLHVELLTPADLGQFDGIVMVDTQPPHLRHPVERIDAVIDHHPVQTSYTARYKDVRNAYGATATILAEYLRAEKVKVNERLATALLYAIRTDTLLLERPVCDADIDAFTWLFPRANTNWIRRIERPELPVAMLPAFAAGLENARIEDRVIFSHLGPVAREDVIPQLAEFCMQIEGADWSVVSGVFEGDLVLSVRNVGFVQRAGAAVKTAFDGLGSAGGHRSMAKAVLPLENLKTSGSVPDAATYTDLENRFLAALKRDEKADSG